MSYDQDEFGLNDERRRIPSELELKANAWMEKNPHVMDLYRKFAREKLSGQHRFGIGALTERVRWECSFNYEDEEFKISNNHRAYIARKLVEENPELKPLIKMAAVGSDRRQT